MVTQEDYWTEISASMVDKVIDGNYQLLEELGRGSYGCLFLGQCLADNTYVAIKILSKSGLDHQQLQLQQLEIDIQSSLKHPYLLGLHRVIQDEKYVFMVMELCDQGDLFDFVIRDPTIMRDERLVKTVFSQILEGVEHMHSQNIYHRDIKLENVLLKCDDEDNDEDFVCKVADFGLATRERYSLEFGCGSTTYLAPEHFDDDQTILVPYDAAASDTWSLGILLLALMFGRNPWEEATSMDPAYAEFKRNPMMLKQQLFPMLTTSCHRFLTKILSVHAADRPTVAEMKQQFLALDRLVLDDTDDELSDEEEPLSPVDIPAVVPQKLDKVNFDSAVFSGTTGTSWSDMIEEDEKTMDLDFDPFGHVYPEHEEDDDTDMFVHSQEKESWWL
ncbi:hypothetical protein DFQ28_010006 [Apophysomyces sp. BC1034]|nr:hypothetical protein DFQ30_009663 [Apophysomyces sp. BC1015]KAG0172230.1 hypothetical protein DFQ29_008473 [Apophysomyces sp. BC1021]KAG0185056.1 hypothetical protein DFQ28_010006 [Apophysomyces sp. BC1034]